MQKTLEIEDWLDSVKADWWKSAIPHRDHEAFQIGIDELSEQVANEVRRIRKMDSVTETCLYLRDNGIPFQAVLLLAKKLHKNT